MPSPIRCLLFGTAVFVALSSVDGLAQAQRPDSPLPNSAPTAGESVAFEAQPPVRLPDADLIVEVVAPLPLRSQVDNVTRLLGRRQTASNGRHDYPTTILELIKLVEPNPAKPRGRSWKTVTALTIGYDKNTKEMSVEYCVEQCTFDKRTKAPHAKRKMILYHSPEEQVLTRVNKKHDELQQFGDSDQALNR